MAITARTLKKWAKTLENDALVAIDEGGLILRLVDDESAYLEIGGVPDEEGYDDDSDEDEKIPREGSRPDCG